MRWGWLGVLGILVAGILPAGGARAACTLGLSVQGVTPVYDFFSGSATAQAYEIGVTHNAGDSCDFFVTFSRGGASTYDRQMVLGGDSLSYQLYSQANQTGVLKDLLDAGSGLEVLSGALSSQDISPRTLTFYLVIPANQVVPPGTYQDTVTVSVYEGTLGGSPVLADADGLVVSSTIARDIQLSLRDTAAPFDPEDNSQSMDFGILEQGESRGFDLMVRTNAGYSVSMVSENQGRLKHMDVPAAANTTVDYTLKINNVAKDLSGTQPIEVTSGTGVTSLEGVRHPTTVTIGTVSGKVAGIYQDTVTITAATVE